MIDTLLTPVTLSSEDLYLDEITSVARDGERVTLSSDPFVTDLIQHSRDTLKRKLAQGELIYGVNTGFGGNVRYVIPADEMIHHQDNLLEFMCCGVGEPLPKEVVRASILIRAKSLVRGLSGVRLVVIQRLLDLLNHDITPLVPRYGSVGASGDLCPMAYIARAMLGRGTVLHRGRRVPAAEALEAEGIPFLKLEAKEGLGLLNGTPVMTGIAATVIDDAYYLFNCALGAIAMAVEALQSSADYYHPVIHMAKDHPGQLRVAEQLSSYLFDSKLAVPLEDIRRRAAAEAHDGVGEGVVAVHQAIQSPYSLRCAPQGLGPVLESLDQARFTIEREANSVSDNPLVDPISDRIYHTGNFYGGSIARAMDGLKLDLANLANWKHSVVALLMDDRFSNGLPPSLSPHVGLYQGFKGAQITVTSLVAAIRHWSAPSLVHTLPTEQFNQDIVSLGTHSALTAMDMVKLLKPVVAITLLAAAQGIDLRGGSGDMAPGTRPIYNAIRSVSPFLDTDRPLDTEIEKLGSLIDQRCIPVMN
jgi:phenylalanine ammonia-lyase